MRAKCDDKVCGAGRGKGEGKPWGSEGGGGYSPTFFSGTTTFPQPEMEFLDNNLTNTQVICSMLFTVPSTGGL